MTDKIQSKYFKTENRSFLRGKSHVKIHIPRNWNIISFMYNVMVITSKIVKFAKLTKQDGCEKKEKMIAGFCQPLPLASRRL